MVDQQIRLTEATALAKAAGLRSPRDRLILAMLNEELPGERQGATWWMVRSHFETWLEGELRLDELEDENIISLPEARALAKVAGVEDYSARVLQAVAMGEIENVQRCGAGWRIPKDGFNEWLEDADTAEDDDLPDDYIRPEILEAMKPTAADVWLGIWEVAKLVALGLFGVACWLGVIWLVLSAG